MLLEFTVNGRWYVHANQIGAKVCLSALSEELGNCIWPKLKKTKQN